MRILPLVTAGLLAVSLQAQSVSTVPVGAVTLTVKAASSPTAPRYTYLNLPLKNEALYVGRIASAGSGSVTVDQDVDQIFSSSNPCFIRILTGSLGGAYYYISSNSGSQLTLATQGQVLNSAESGLQAGEEGDRFEIIPADTIGSLFDGSVVLGGVSAAQADQIWLWQPSSGQFTRYYYNTENGRWQDTFFQSNSNNVVIRPDGGFVYVRRATTDLSFSIVGVVPELGAKIHIKDSGYTLVSAGYPADVTLGGMALHMNDGWLKSTTASEADQIWVWNVNTGQYTRYYHTGVMWRDTFFGIDATNTSIPAGSAIMVKRAAVSGVNFSVFSTIRPYSL